METESRNETILALIESVSCGILARDLAGIVLYANKSLLNWLQYERDEVEGLSVDRLVPVDLQSLLHEEIKAVDSGDLRARLIVLMRKDGTTFPVIALPRRLYNDRNAQTGGVAVLVELGALQSAKPISYGGESGVRASLDKIALDVQSLALTAGIGPHGTRTLDASQVAELSDREREVTALLLSGDRVSVIANSLHISPHTVRNHLKSVFRKFEVGSQSELIERIRSSPVD